MNPKPSTGNLPEQPGRRGFVRVVAGSSLAAFDEEGCGERDTRFTRDEQLLMLTRRCLPGCPMRVATAGRTPTCLPAPERSPFPPHGARLVRCA